MPLCCSACHPALTGFIQKAAELEVTCVQLKKILKPNRVCTEICLCLFNTLNVFVVDERADRPLHEHTLSITEWSSAWEPFQYIREGKEREGEKAYS